MQSLLQPKTKGVLYLDQERNMHSCDHNVRIFSLVFCYSLVPRGVRFTQRQHAAVLKCLKNSKSINFAIEPIARRILLYDDGYKLPNIFFFFAKLIIGRDVIFPLIFKWCDNIYGLILSSCEPLHTIYDIVNNKRRWDWLTKQRFTDN